jgi:hypothetical protein
MLFAEEFRRACMAWQQQQQDAPAAEGGGPSGPTWIMKPSSKSQVGL